MELRSTVVLSLLLAILGLVAGILMGRDASAGAGAAPSLEDHVTVLVIEPGVFIPHDGADGPVRPAR